MLDDLDTTKAVLEPYIEGLSSAMHTGFNRFIGLSPRDKVDMRSTTRAGVVHDFQTKEIEKLSEVHQGLRVDRYGELALLVIENRFAVKIKKLNQNRKSRSQLTQQVKDFLNQSLSLPGIVRVISLELGYTLNILGGIDDVLIVCPNGRYDNFWEWGIDTGNKNICQLLPFKKEEHSEDQEQQKISNRYSTNKDEATRDEYIEGKKDDK